MAHFLSFALNCPALAEAPLVPKEQVIARVMQELWEVLFLA